MIDMLKKAVSLGGSDVFIIPRLYAHGQGARQF